MQDLESMPLLPGALAKVGTGEPGTSLLCYVVATLLHWGTSMIVASGARVRQRERKRDEIKVQIHFKESLFLLSKSQLILCPTREYFFFFV